MVLDDSGVNVFKGQLRVNCGMLQKACFTEKKEVEQ